jgi:peptidyl-tRNA hydrolase, PTH1 family
MNVSGPAIARKLRDTRLQPKNLIVLHDSLYHKPQTISLKSGGSANGHNGIRDIIRALGQDGFQRLRLGIGKNDYDAAQYVLEKLSPEELYYWGDDGKGVDVAWKAIETMVTRLRDGPTL